jgi:hypothetical protein
MPDIEAPRTSGDFTIHDLREEEFLAPNLLQQLEAHRAQQQAVENTEASQARCCCTTKKKGETCGLVAFVLTLATLLTWMSVAINHQPETDAD